MTQEALKLALEALEGIQRYGLDTLSGRVDGPDSREWQRAGVNEMTKRARLGITAIKEALAQPEQEPVALEEKFSLLLWDYQELERAFEKVTGGKWVRKSNTPQRTWVGLTDEETETLIHRFDGDPHTLLDEVNARLKEKNT